MGFLKTVAFNSLPSLKFALKNFAHWKFSSPWKIIAVENPTSRKFAPPQKKNVGILPNNKEYT